VLAPRLGALAVLENAWDEDGTLDFLLDSGGTFYGGTDTVLNRLCEAARRRDLKIPLRAVAVGGSMLRRETLAAVEREFGVCVLRVYGSSEAPNSTGSRPDEPWDVRLHDDGWPGPGVEVDVGRDSLQEVKVRGPHLFRGYLDPADNRDVFDGEWFRTGDAAELVGSRLRVIGRLKEVASRNGRKISLAEVEEAFRVVAPVERCAAFSVPDRTTGERVALAVQLPRDQKIDVPAALDAMRARGLARWKLPETVVIYTDAFPLTSTGKVVRRQLAEANGTLLWQADRLSSERQDASP
jgi:acyl-CoA synthetase (AMP-forming)/AMP-acid ligase II